MQENTTQLILQKDFASHPLLARLLELHEIPKQISIEGVLPEVVIDEYGRSTPRILTIVGSRKNTSYGRRVLEKLVTSLKDHDVIILSGLAIGIDGLAHTFALKNNLRTIAVPGSGLDKKILYPRSHLSLAKTITENHGALISEFDTTTPAALWTFPKRNRIMAALSDALLIIEAEEKSGTLITARLALELGRDIGAVPGEIFSPNAIGTNTLIHEGAYSISSVDDLFSLLHLSKKESLAEPHYTTPLTKHEQCIIDILREPCNKDLLFQKTKLSFEDFIVAFSSLEINGKLEETFGEVTRLV